MADTTPDTPTTESEEERPGVQITLGPAGVAGIKRATELLARDPANNDDLSRTTSEAVQLYAWLLERKAEGWTPCVADTDGTVHRVEM